MAMRVAADCRSARRPPRVWTALARAPEKGRCRHRMFFSLNGRRIMGNAHGGRAAFMTRRQMAGEQRSMPLAPRFRPNVGRVNSAPGDDVLANQKVYSAYCADHFRPLPAYRHQLSGHARRTERTSSCCCLLDGGSKHGWAVSTFPTGHARQRRHVRLRGGTGDE